MKPCANCGHKFSADEAKEKHEPEDGRKSAKAWRCPKCLLWCQLDRG